LNSNESYLCAAAVPYPMSVSRGEVIASWKLIPNIPHILAYVGIVAIFAASSEAFIQTKNVN